MYSILPVALREIIFKYVITPGVIIRNKEITDIPGVVEFVYPWVRIIVHFGEDYSKILAREMLNTFMTEFNDHLFGIMRTSVTPPRDVLRFIEPRGVKTGEYFNYFVRYRAYGDIMLECYYLGNSINCSFQLSELILRDEAGIYVGNTTLTIETNKRTVYINLPHVMINNNYPGVITRIIKTVIPVTEYFVGTPNTKRKCEFCCVIVELLDTCTVCQCFAFNKDLNSGVHELHPGKLLDKLIRTNVSHLLIQYGYTIMTPEIWRSRFLTLRDDCTAQELYDRMHMTSPGVLFFEEWCGVFWERFGAVTRRRILRAKIHRSDKHDVFIHRNICADTNTGTNRRLIYASCIDNYTAPGGVNNYKSHVNKCEIMTAQHYRYYKNIPVSRGECCICFENIMTDNPRGWYKCRVCKTEIHRGCYDQMITKKCPVCRS